MAAFKFRLDGLLQLRKRREESQERAVAMQFGRVQSTQVRLERLTAQMAEHTDRLRNTMRGERLDLEDVVQVRQWLGRLRRESLATQDDLAAAERQLVAERARLAAAMRETRVLSNLRDRRFGEFRRRMDRIEAQALDEFSITRFVARDEQGEP